MWWIASHFVCHQFRKGWGVLLNRRHRVSRPNGDKMMTCKKEKDKFRFSSPGVIYGWLLCFYSFQIRNKDARLGFHTKFDWRIGARTILPWMPALPSAQTGSSRMSTLNQREGKAKMMQWRGQVDRVRNPFHKPRPTHRSLAAKIYSKKSQSIAKSINTRDKVQFFFFFFLFLLFFFLQIHFCLESKTPSESKRYFNFVRNEVGVKKIVSFMRQRKSFNHSEFKVLPKGDSSRRLSRR